MAKVTGNNQAVSIMRKYAFTLMALAAMFGLSSCDKELVPAEDFNNNNKKYVIYASTEDSRTKTSISGNDAEGYQVFWSEGDHFYVYELTTVTDWQTHFPKQMFQRVEGAFNLISGAGTTRGTFEREGDALPNLTITALYSDSPEAFSPSYISDFYPTEQTYSEGNIKGFPMLAQINVNNGEITGPISFKNMNGILRLTVKGTATVKSIKVSAAELPTPITLDCGAGVALTSEGKLFHIAMPTDAETSKTYTDVVITLTGTDDKEICTKKFMGTDGLVIERSKITKASFSTYKVGDKLTIGGHEGIVVKINGKLVIVATMNVGATVANGTGCLGEKLNYDAACSAWSGWRLPTVDEIKTLCDVDYPTRGDIMEGEGNGALLWYIDDNDGIDLYLPLDEYEEVYPYGKYWTGTPGEKDTEKCFYFAPELDWESGSDHDYVPVGYYYRSEEVPYKEEAAKTSEFLVRLFHNIP